GRGSMAGGGRTGRASSTRCGWRRGSTSPLRVWAPPGERSGRGLRTRSSWGRRTLPEPQPCLTYSYQCLMMGRRSGMPGNDHPDCDMMPPQLTLQGGTMSKKPKAGNIAGLGCLSLVAIIVGVFIIAIATSDGDSNDGSDNK